MSVAYDMSDLCSTRSVHVFAPCAMGAIISDQTIPRLKARVVAGAANNQLSEARHGEELMSHGIL